MAKPQRLEDARYEREHWKELTGLPPKTWCDVQGDDAIRPLLKALCEAGYVTTTSCAGHPGVPVLETGFIRFSTDVDDLGLGEREEVKTIARRHGLRNVRFHVEEIGTTVTFNPLGGRRSP